MGRGIDNAMIASGHGPIGSAVRGRPQHRYRWRAGPAWRGDIDAGRAAPRRGWLPVPPFCVVTTAALLAHLDINGISLPAVPTSPTGIDAIKQAVAFDDARTLRWWRKARYSRRPWSSLAVGHRDPFKPKRLAACAGPCCTALYEHFGEASPTTLLSIC